MGHIELPVGTGIMDGSLNGSEKVQRLSNAYSKELVKEVKDMTTYMEKQTEARIRPRIKKQLEKQLEKQIEERTRDVSFIEMVCNIFKSVSDPVKIAQLVCRDEDDVRAALVKGGVIPPSA